MWGEQAARSILLPAIQREIEARDLYARIARLSSRPEAREMLLELSAQEEGHRRHLEAMLQRADAEGWQPVRVTAVQDLKITDYLVETPLGPDADLLEVLVVAGKREKASHDLYASLARIAEDQATGTLFHVLADEELSHKRRVEELYERLALMDN